MGEHRTQGIAKTSPDSGREKRHNGRKWPRKNTKSGEVNFYAACNPLMWLTHWKEAWTRLPENKISTKYVPFLYDLKKSKDFSPSAPASLLCSSCYHWVSSSVPASRLLACSETSEKTQLDEAPQLRVGITSLTLLEQMVFCATLTDASQSVSVTVWLRQRRTVAPSVSLSIFSLRDSLFLPRQDQSCPCMKSLGLAFCLTLPVSPLQMRHHKLLWTPSWDTVDLLCSDIDRNGGRWSAKSDIMLPPTACVC